MASSPIQDALAERFLRYSAISSQSDASSTTVPTSEGQWELARLLKSELEEAGAEEIHLSDTCVLTAKVPSNLPGDATAPAIGLHPPRHGRCESFPGRESPRDRVRRRGCVPQ